MKTAISLPDDVYRDAEKYARRKGKSRSRVYAEAVAEYLARHTPDAVTESMNQVCALLDGKKDPFPEEAARQLLGNEDW